MAQKSSKATGTNAGARDVSSVKSAPALDLTGVTPSVVKPDAVKRDQGSKYDNSPINDWLAASFKDGDARQVTLKSDQVTPFKTAVRACAARLHIGHRFGDDVTNEDGTVTVTFMGKAPKQRKPKDATATAPASDTEQGDGNSL